MILNSELTGFNVHGKLNINAWILISDGNSRHRHATVHTSYYFTLVIAFKKQCRGYSHIYQLILTINKFEAEKIHMNFKPFTVQVI